MSHDPCTTSGYCSSGTEWAAAGLPVSISQKAKQDALEHADIIDSLKKGSVAIRKYDMTAAQAAGDYSEDMYVATGEKDTVAEQKLADYAMEGVQFSCLRVGNIETQQCSERNRDIRGTDL